MRVTTVIGLMLLVLGILIFLGCVDSTGPVECVPTDSTPLVSAATSLHTVDTVAWVRVGFCIDIVWPWLP